MKRLVISKKNIQEAKNLVDGVYFPLKGFLNARELNSILDNFKLPNGEIWSMPIVLDISEEEKKEIENENEVEISDKQNKNIFILKNIQVFPLEKENFMRKLFGTNDPVHPGIKRVEEMDNWILSGEIYLKKRETENDFYLTPLQAKNIFQEKGWKKIVAFQTRNAPHLSHEHLQMHALKKVDGLFVQPIIGEKKAGDFNDEYIIGSYEILFEKYLPRDKAMFGTFKTFMRYAGPREAIFHALVRRNFGCTHMIIGRDHAGVKNFYGAYDSQDIFNNFSKDELGVKILKYDNATFCKKCGGVVFNRDCPHKREDKIFLSGTELRNKLLNNEEIPEEFMRREVKEYLENNKDNLFVK